MPPITRVIRHAQTSFFAHLPVPNTNKIIQLSLPKNFRPPHIQISKESPKNLIKRTKKWPVTIVVVFCTHPKCVNLNNGPHHLISLRNKKGVGRAGKRYSVPVSKCPRGDGMFHYIFINPSHNTQKKVPFGGWREQQHVREEKGG